MRRMEKARWLAGFVLVAVAAAGLTACGDDRASVGLSTSGGESTGTTLPSTSSSVTTEPVPSTVPEIATTVPRGRPVKSVPGTVTVPAVPLPTLPVTVPVVTSTTTSPLPVPELFDARQGLGTPCDSAVERHPEGCFFFVYATPATKGWHLRIHSDAPFRTEQPLGPSNDCGTAHPHHSDRAGCVFYIGAVHDRVAGQRECFWATTVQGDRESAPSNQVCFTWADQASAPSS